MKGNRFFTEEFFSCTRRERKQKKLEFKSLLEKKQAMIVREIIAVLCDGDKEKNNILHDFISSSVTMDQWSGIKKSVWSIRISDKKREKWAMMLGGFIRI